MIFESTVELILDADSKINDKLRIECLVVLSCHFDLTGVAKAIDALLVRVHNKCDEDEFMEPVDPVYELQEASPTDVLKLTVELCSN